MDNVVATMSEPSDSVFSAYGVECFRGSFHQSFASAGSDPAQDGLHFLEKASSMGLKSGE